MQLQGEKLYQLARDGQKLSSNERRHCLKWALMALPEMSMEDLANLFKVTKRAIYQDKTYIRRAKVKEVKGEDVMFLIGDLKMAFEKTLRDIAHSKRKAVLGSKTYLDHCRAEFDLQKQLIGLWQDIGLVPKDLSNLTVNQYVFQSSIIADNNAEKRPIELPAQNVQVISLGQEYPVKLAITNGQEHNTDDEPFSTESGFQTCIIEASSSSS